MSRASLLTQYDARSPNDFDWSLSTIGTRRRDRYTQSGLGQSRRTEVRISEGGIVIKCEDKEPAWLRPTVQALIELLDLSENWDSYGARPISQEIAFFALQLLDETMRADTPAPTVVPTNRGGIQFEWHTRGIDLEIEIQSPERTYVSYEDHRSGNEWEAEITSDLTRLSDALSELSRRG